MVHMAKGFSAAVMARIMCICLALLATRADRSSLPEEPLNANHCMVANDIVKDGTFPVVCREAVKHGCDGKCCSARGCKTVRPRHGRRDKVTTYDVPAVPKAVS